ncbi:MAG: iron-containing alcohol dehydrogenase [Commensalibacter sp.]|nr:iron-containing alcohol dehydrogenase [Commensalibacter sp.]
MAIQNFEYCNPTRIVFGQDTISRLDDLIPKGAYVLITIGGGSVRRTGTLSEVEKALGDRKFSVFEGIEANPTYETLMKAVERIRQEKFTFILGVGGGSVMDGTKFIAAAVHFNGDPWNIVLQKGSNIQSVIPFGFVLTLPATGSEMNYYAVISRKETKDKIGIASDFLYPIFSILDPTKTYSLPSHQVANGIADAFVHVIEQYLTYPSHADVQDRFSESLLLTLIEEGPKTLAYPNDYTSRANFVWAATLALNGLIATGVAQDWATHIIGHEMTVLYGIDHGRTLSIILPSLLHIMRESKKDKLLQYAHRIWNIHYDDQEKTIDEAIHRTRQFFESLGIKTHLRDYNLDEKAIDEIIDQLHRHNLTALGERQNITLEISRKILQASL